VFASHAELAAALQADIANATAPLRVLVKGSRGSAMDKIVTALLAHGEEAPNAA
jgi:UDP-N-acetylmuramoyl-tripeptide--D-alanyl-D-alanine ligase